MFIIRWSVGSYDFRFPCTLTNVILWWTSGYFETEKKLKEHCWELERCLMLRYTTDYHQHTVIFWRFTFTCKNRLRHLVKQTSVSLDDVQIRYDFGPEDICVSCAWGMEIRALLCCMSLLAENAGLMVNRLRLTNRPTPLEAESFKRWQIYRSLYARWFWKHKHLHYSGPLMSLYGAVSVYIQWGLVASRGVMGAIKF